MRYATYVVINPSIIDPSITSGTIREIDLISKNYLRKCIWIMPENLMGRNWSAGILVPNPVQITGGKGWRGPAHYDFETAWKNVRSALANTPPHLRLPEYHRDGMLFTLSESGKLESAVHLPLSRTLLKVRKLRSAFSTLVNLPVESAALNKQSNRGMTIAYRVPLYVIAMVSLMISAYFFVRHGFAVGAYLFCVCGIGFLWRAFSADDFDVFHRALRKARHSLPRQFSEHSGMRRALDRLAAYTVKAISTALNDAGWRRLGFYAIWIVFWCMGEWVTIGELFWGEHGLFIEIVLGFWLLGWSLGGVYVLLEFLSLLIQRNRSGS